ncbi:MAG: M48 family metallopeptidase [Candidatus Thorarchaeota archaeon]
MMPEIVVGKTVIPYLVRVSSIAKKISINVSPTEVEVVVPRNSTVEAVEAVVAKRASWIYTKWDELREKAHWEETATPEHYRSGAKILYRGRRVMLHISPADTKTIDVAYQNGFHVKVPMELHEGRWDTEIHLFIQNWMKQKVLEDCRVFSRKYSMKLDLYPKDIRVKDQKHLWGSCGKDRVINVNWRLAFMPKRILEYVVVHEVVHLRYRNHSKVFWTLLRSVFAEVEVCQKLLDGPPSL